MISPGLRFGRYEVGDRIGKGGFGVVHFARDVELGRDLAIKFLRPEYQAKPNVVQRFLQEARAAARIGHPGIVTVFECGQIGGTGLRADGTAFIAMELLRGKSLSERIEDDGRPPLEMVLSIGRQLASALASAHEAGIIHRDLKPDNVFLIPDPAVRGGVRIKILDFGVAKLAEPVELGVHTHSQVMLGTPRYMAPEQARSAARVDHRSDVYALGCMLFELLSGRPPYSGDTPDVLTKHQSAPVPSVRRIVESTPRELDQLISRMLAKAPEERPRSMMEVDGALGACEAQIARAAMIDPAEEETIAEATLPVPRLEESTLVRSPLAPLAPLTQLPSAPAPSAQRTQPGTGTFVPAAPRAATAQAAPRAATAPAPSPLSPDAPTTQMAPIVLDAPGSPGVESTLSEATAVRPPRPPAARSSRLLLVIAGGLVLGGLVTFLAVRSAGDGPAAGPAPTAADAALALAPADAAEPDAAVAEPDAAVAAPAPAPPAEVPDAALPAGGDGTASATELEVECLRYQAEQKWGDLDACARRLQAVNPAAAKAFADRAVLETRAAPRIAAVEAALRDKNLKKAKAGLDAIPAAATGAAKLRQRYEQAEAQAIADVVARLQRARDRDCKEYNQLLQQEKAAKPPRVAAEAARQVKCTPGSPGSPAACDHEELSDKGREHYSMGQLNAALASYEAAWSCKPDAQYAEKAFVIACNVPSIGKARLFWKRMTVTSRQRAVMICVRNRITEDILNAP